MKQLPHADTYFRLPTNVWCVVKNSWASEGTSTAFYDDEMNLLKTLPLCMIGYNSVHLFFQSWNNITVTDYDGNVLVEEHTKYCSSTVNTHTECMSAYFTFSKHDKGCSISVSSLSKQKIEEKKQQWEKLSDEEKMAKNHEWQSNVGVYDGRTNKIFTTNLGLTWFAHQGEDKQWECSVVKQNEDLSDTFYNTYTLDFDFDSFMFHPSGIACNSYYHSPLTVFDLHSGVTLFTYNGYWTEREISTSGSYIAITFEDLFLIYHIKTKVLVHSSDHNRRIRDITWCDDVLYIIYSNGEWATFSPPKITGLKTMAKLLILNNHDLLLKDNYDDNFRDTIFKVFQNVERKLVTSDE